jgi:hypothetical protein
MSRVKDKIVGYVVLIIVIVVILIAFIIGMNVGKESSFSTYNPITPVQVECRNVSSIGGITGLVDLKITNNTNRNLSNVTVQITNLDGNRNLIRARSKTFNDIAANSTYEQQVSIPGRTVYCNCEVINY